MQICTQKYITSPQRGVHLHPLNPALNHHPITHLSQDHPLGFNDWTLGNTVTHTILASSQPFLSAKVQQALKSSWTVQQHSTLLPPIQNMNAPYSGHIAVVTMVFALEGFLSKHFCRTVQTLCTCTVEPISFKAFPTCAVEASIFVSADGIGTACMYLQFTLIDICKYKV